MGASAERWGDWGLDCSEIRSSHGFANRVEAALLATLTARDTWPDCAI